MTNSVSLSVNIESPCAAPLPPSFSRNPWEVTSSKISLFFNTLKEILVNSILLVKGHLFRDAASLARYRIISLEKNLSFHEKYFDEDDLHLKKTTKETMLLVLEHLVYDFQSPTSLSLKQAIMGEKFPTPYDCLKGLDLLEEHKESPSALFQIRRGSNIDEIPNLQSSEYFFEYFKLDSIDNYNSHLDPDQKPLRVEWTELRKNIRSSASDLKGALFGSTTLSPPEQNFLSSLINVYHGNPSLSTPSNALAGFPFKNNYTIWGLNPISVFPKKHSSLQSIYFVAKKALFHLILWIRKFLSGDEKASLYLQLAKIEFELREKENHPHSTNFDWIKNHTSELLLKQLHLFSLLFPEHIDPSLNLETACRSLNRFDAFLNGYLDQEDKSQLPKQNSPERRNSKPIFTSAQKELYYELSKNWTELRKTLYQEVQSFSSIYLNVQFKAKYEEIFSLVVSHLERLSK